MNRIYITVFLLGLCLCFCSCKHNPDQSKKDVAFQDSKLDSESLKYLIRLPENQSNEPLPLLILLHGLGSNEQDMHRLAHSLDARALILSVRAPHRVGDGKYSWFDLKKGGTGWVYSFEELQASRSKIIRLIQTIQKEYSIDEEKIIVGGFSQGAITSLATGLSHSKLIDGVMVLSGDLYDEVEKEMEGRKINKNLDIYMSHGRQDQVLSFTEAVRDVKFLKAKGIDVYEQYFDSAHTISKENYISMNKWLKAKIDHVEN